MKAALVKTVVHALTKSMVLSATAHQAFREIDVRQVRINYVPFTMNSKRRTQNSIAFELLMVILIIIIIIIIIIMILMMILQIKFKRKC